MKRRLIRAIHFALAFAPGLACLLSQSAAWAESPFGRALSDQDPIIQAVMEVQDRETDRFLRIPGVVGTATTILPDGQIAVKVLTQYRGVGRALPKFLEDIPVAVEEVGDIRALAFTEKYNTVTAGVSMGNKNECAAGTNGAVVTKSGADYFLSNNHVFARENKAAKGEDILQPGRVDSDPQCAAAFPNHVADLSEFKKIQFGFFGINRIDAAIARIKTDTTAYSCTTECGYTPGSIPKAVSLDMEVKKCGRTTMLTTGTVTGLNVSVFVSYSGGKLAFFTGQLQFSAKSGEGDSGSLIVDEVTNDPVALLFAGSATTTIGNPITAVLNNFGVSICGS
ncbi:MAG: hypothetical protein ACREYE_00595 [Gammaproteobacteria bacterium]